MNSVGPVVPSFTRTFSPTERSRVVTALFEKSPTSIAVIDQSGATLWLNDACARLLGIESATAIATSPISFDSARLGGEAWAGLVDAMHRGAPWHGQMRGTRHSGAAYACAVSVVPVAPPDDVADKPLYVATLVDETQHKNLQAEIVENFPLYHRAVENSPDGLVVVDRSGRVVFCNTAATRLLSRTEAQLLGREFGYPFAAGGRATEIELFIGGDPRFVELTASSIVWHEEDATLLSLHDVTERRQTATVIDLQAKAMAASANGIFTTNAAGAIEWANDALSAISGYPLAELIGCNLSIFKSGRHPKSFYRDMWDRLNRGEIWQGRIVNRRRNGQAYTAEQRITPVRDAAGRIAQFVSIQEDITERLKAQDEIIRLAQYDTLTDLPNRTLFVERLRSAIARAKRSGEMLAVMLIDLDNFKMINSSLGHDVGDGLLNAARDRLNSTLRTTDTLARLGGDEFGVLLESVRDTGVANVTVRRVFECFAQPLKIENHAFKVAASAGIAIYPKDDLTPDGLLAQAELAMYQAKAQGRSTFCYFDRDADIRRRLALEADLQSAIENRQLWLAYQPQVDLLSGRVVGAEALIRWTHPTRGLVSPGDFIPVAESSDLILSIGEWIIGEICRQSQDWQGQGLPQIQVGFNVSGVQFRRADLHGQVMAMLERAGLSREAIDIEVTETVAMERTSRVQENFGRLTNDGISISMDDFGTGYSSLSNLSAFPVKRLKVDGSFVSGIGLRRDAEKIIEAIIGLGQSLGLRVVAEGVETEEQARFLHQRGCDEIQGYLVSKPLPPDAFVRFVSEFGGLRLT